MTSLESHIRDLIFFYVKTNYNDYLKTNQLKSIPKDQIHNVVNQLYTERKDHLKIFIKSSLKQLLKEEYPGDLIILNILNDIFSDDDFCKHRLCNEIIIYQESK